MQGAGTRTLITLEDLKKLLEKVGRESLTQPAANAAAGTIVNHKLAGFS
jgi:hypothetical protein